MRRLAIILGSVAAFVLLVALSLPWWFGFALNHIGPRFGLTFGDYQRNGYSHFAVQAVQYERYGVRVKVDRVEADTPLLWWWHRASGQPTAVVAGKWSTDVLPSDAPATPGKNRGWTPLRHQLDRVADILAFWLPKAEMGPGVVTWRGGQLDFGPSRWSDRTLDASLVSYRILAAAVKLDVPKGKAMHAVLTMKDGSGTVELQSLDRNVTAIAIWWGQRADVEATFGSEGWMPPEASLQSRGWALPGERAKLGNVYAVIRGEADVRWKNGDLTAVMSADGEPTPASKAPPLSIKVRGHGEAGLFFADVMDVSLPGISAHLNEPVSIDRFGKLKSAASRFVVSCDLSKQPWFPAQGTFGGEGTISAGDEGIARVDFSLRGSNLNVARIALSAVDAQGQFEWPRLSVAQGKITMTDGNVLAVRGGANFRAQEISDVVISGKLGRGLVAKWLPDSFTFEPAAIEARGSGPWKTFSHEGKIGMSAVSLEKLNPMTVDVVWKGRGPLIDQMTTNVSAGATKVVASASVGSDSVNISALTLANGATERLHLVRPVNFRWAPQPELDLLQLEGPGSQVQARLVWGKSGTFETSIRNLQSEWFRELVKFPSTVWAVDSLDAHANWANGPATFSVDGLGTVHLGPERAAQLSVVLNGDSAGLKITSARIAEGTGRIVSASGQIPVVVTPAGAAFLKINPDAALSLQAATSPNPQFWDKLSELAGVEIVNPEMLVNLSGTWSKPAGDAQLHADRVLARPDRFRLPWPKIEALNVRLTGDPAGLKLDSFSVAIDDQQVRADGTLPISAERWAELVRDPQAFARHGNLHVEVPDADIAALAHHFPAYLAPKGRLQLDLTFKSDETITGFLRVTDATSRPLGPLGVLQEVNAKLVFDGRGVNLEGVTAKMGGQAVTLQGRAELPKGERARLDLTLKGDNLPFVRRTGLLIRGDLDLKLTGAGNAASISGDVRLRESLFLTDVRALIPTGAKGSVHRPPYFSIEAEPLNSWRLNVGVNGERFLRLRTPVFNGTASARFRLSGTLGEPHIEGEASIDEGTVRLPFANFAVQQGQVRLSPEQLEPQIWITGTTRRYGYDVRMELSGSTSAQNLTFTSSPPLEAEQVLLMVMAGQAPQNEITTTDRQRAARFGAFFGQSLLGSIGGDASGADRLTISSGENISSQGRETYTIEYRLNPKWSLTGEYDEFDDYNGGLKWRFYERGGKNGNEKKK